MTISNLSIVTSTRAQIMEAGSSLVETLVAIDRQARREARSLPTDLERRRLTQEFWQLMDVVARHEDTKETDEVTAVKAELRLLLAPWLLRSRFWARASIKPHGYAGDFRMIEWIYDLEGDACEDPTQPAIVNALDGLMATVHSAWAVWHRRWWYRQAIESMCETLDRPVRVLDIACGGSRYTRDALDRYPGRVQLAAIDQDPAAIAFTDSWLPMTARAPDGLICAPIKYLADRIVPSPDPRDRFDIVMSTGLFDYLDDEVARNLLCYMIELTRPGGVTAICNFSPHDKSRLVKTWLSDWNLLYRDEAGVRALFPSQVGGHVHMSTSPDGGLVYARLVHRWPEASWRDYRPGPPANRSQPA